MATNSASNYSTPGHVGSTVAPFNLSVECADVWVDPTPANHCSVYHDGLLCWSAIPGNSTAALSCPNIPSNGSVRAFAYRYCPTNASWENQLSNYTECLQWQFPTNTEDPTWSGMIHMAEIIRDVTFILCTLSLVSLIVTIIIFQYFKSLQCSRICIHKQLVVSFIIRFIVNIIIVEPYVSGRDSSYRDTDWLCKVITALFQYSILANIFWMFVEGFFLHHSLVLGVFSSAPPFKLFYFIGWGLPFTFVLSWSITLHFTHDSKCWAKYSQNAYYYIITVPFTVALVINLVFLVNIIRVLVSKLRAHNRVESANIRKAIKATVVLLPLLGLTNLLFFMSPGDSQGMKTAYHITNAILQSSQGMFVAVLYCFMNGEVRRVMKQKWYRFKIRYVLHRQTGRRRSSRTSSFFLSQTEVHPFRVIRSKMCPVLNKNVFCEDSSTDPEYRDCPNCSNCAPKHDCSNCAPKHDCSNSAPKHDCSNCSTKHDCSNSAPNVETSYTDEPKDDPYSCAWKKCAYEMNDGDVQC